MKYTIILTALAVFSLFYSCNKQNESKQEETNKEIGLEQKPHVLKNDVGDSLSIVYFAQGDEVALNMKINQREYKLSAKGTNDKGEPIFSDGKYAWEMMEDGVSGRLTDASGKTQIYK